MDRADPALFPVFADGTVLKAVDDGKIIIDRGDDVVQRNVGKRFAEKTAAAGARV